ncbi:Lrp/AsnC family transcriptional regulator [Fictibacillus barbaricus]|uniref:Lrp/AsnC family transcriptional regulator n=1 Tax=Fictibacillus barbaricus TaxID=182136 RepID=A0ABS2ZHP7_9BACL|nr:Lrp/AsnC family transcriptional regulator [Fictibacillus barbaricus]MBN3546853.1 Lrp/AsnC family transcriptional regulator [Fictibacillus barbaricus]GGB44322.1 HTH-type transcriptional regulator LrpA [Fictibacillus barbaricus]
MLDNTDSHILDELSKNSRITMKELGEKVHLTGPATSARVAKLEDSGIIEGYTIKVNQEKMGYSVHSIIHVYTKNTNHQPYLSFIKNHNQYVINNYKVSGESCYLLECKFQSNAILDEFLTGLSNFVSYKLSIVINK